MLQYPFKNYSLKNIQKPDFWIRVFLIAISFFLFMLLVSAGMDHVLDIFGLEWYRGTSVKSYVFKISISIGYGFLAASKKEVRHELPKMQNPPPPPEKKISIKDVYEFLETRAQNYETIQDCHKNEAFPLYVNINEVYHVLSMYHNGEFGQFLRMKGLCYDHGFGCDADDHKLPEFPAAKSKKFSKYPNPPEPPPARRIRRL